MDSQFVTKALDIATEHERDFAGKPGQAFDAETEAVPEHEADLERAYGECAKLRARIRQLERDNLELRNAQESQTARLTMLQRHRPRVTAQLTAQGASYLKEISELKTFCEELNARLHESEQQRTAVQSANEKLTAHCDALNRQIVELLGTLEEASTELKASFGETAQVRLELTRARDEVRELEARLGDGERALVQRAARFDKHEERLQHYARALTEERKSFHTLCQRLADEVRTARSLHPLRDSLSFTDYSLQKIDQQLKITPVSSPDRAAQEASVASLFEQRRMLKHLIEAGTAELDDQASQIEKIADAVTLSASTPPPPPRPVRVLSPVIKADSMLGDTSLTSIPKGSID